MRLTGKTACQPQCLSVFLVVNVEILYIVNVFNFVFVDKFYLILSFNCAGKLPGETARLYECVREVRDTLRRLGFRLG